MNANTQTTNDQTISMNQNNSNHKENAMKENNTTNNVIETLGACIIVKQSANIVHISHPEPERMIEDTARICYRGQNRIGEDTAEPLVRKLDASGHETPFEFVDVIVDVTTDLNTSHQLVRHRLCSFMQESKRYTSLEDECRFVKPVGLLKDTTQYEVWAKHCMAAYEAYIELRSYDCRMQEARRVLPGSLATTLRIKANIREWRHILKLRCHASADPQMRRLMLDLAEQLHERLPLFFPAVNAEDEAIAEPVEPIPEPELD